MELILQSEAAECGLASIAMVADHHGHKTDLYTLRQQHPQTLKGANLQQLIDIADGLHLSSRALKLDVESLPQLQLPCVIHWDMNHFVVLKSVNRKSIEIFDPGVGKRLMSKAEFSKHFTGIALELTPSSTFNQIDERVKLKFTSLLRAVSGLKPALILLLAMSLLIQLFTLAMPYYMQLTLDEVLVSYDQNLLLVLAIGFGLISLFNVLMTALRSFTIIHLGANLNQQLAFNLFRHLLRLPQDFFSKRHIGDVVSRFQSLEQIKQMITNSMVEVFIDGLIAIITLSILLIYSPTLTTVVIVAMLFYGAIRFAWYRPLKRLTEETIVAAAKENSNFMETVRGVQTIKQFGLESQRQAIWQNHFTDTLNLSVQSSRLKVTYQMANGLLFGLENIIVIYMGASMIMKADSNHYFSIGMLIAFVAYKAQLTQKFTSLIDKLIEFKMLGLHLNRLADIALQNREAHLAANCQKQLSGQITLSQVTFQYSKTEPCLFSDLHFNCHAGESIAIVGPSGCGKSTLLKIMMGLYEPSQGKVQVDGANLSQLGLKQYRAQVASVNQDDELFSGSIAENIALFAPQIDLEKVTCCAQMASIHDEIESMPMAYNSLIGDMGSALSGGQKQRILIARALYQSPKLLFLDEATSHLDLVSENTVNKNIKKLNITRVFIAHRPETVLTADRIYQLEPNQLIDVTSQFRQQSRAKVD